MTPIAIAIIYAAIAVGTFVFVRRDSNGGVPVIVSLMFAVFWPWLILMILIAGAMARK